MPHRPWCKTCGLWLRDPNIVVRSLNSDEILHQQGIISEYHPMPEISAFYQSYVIGCNTKSLG